MSIDPRTPLGRWLGTFLVLAGAVGNPASASALQIRTQQVQGVVRDVVTGAPLEDVTVSVQGSENRAFTDPQGRFILRSVPAGSWVLVVSHLGYGPLNYPMDLEPGGFAQVEITLAPEGVEPSRAWSVPNASGPGEPRVGNVPRRRRSFDWSQDPSGHHFTTAFLGALAGNAAGLTAGVTLGRQCVFIEDGTREIEFSCGNAGVAGVGVAAVALPALGSALGARLGGRTDASVGRFVPAVVGGAMGALPGFIFALATVGEGVETMNAVGKGFLVLAPPLFTTLADRLFRSLR